jgi:acyl-CoA thioesterase-2
MTAADGAENRETTPETNLWSFLGLVPSAADSAEWTQRVTRRVSNPGGVLFGGCALAAGITIAEHATGRPLVTATAQFHSQASPGTELTYRAAVGRQGRSVSLVEVTADADRQRAFTVLAVTGRGQAGLTGSWARAVWAPDPACCPVRELPARMTGGIFDSLEMRQVTGRQMSELRGIAGAGKLVFWGRPRIHLRTSAGLLAVLADALPSSIAEGLGMVMGSISLDHSIRVIATRPDPGWVLCEFQADAVAGGFGHAHGRLWSADGELLATASQSVLARPYLDADS